MFSSITNFFNQPAKSPSSSQILPKIQLEEYGINLATDLDNLTKNINNRYEEYLNSGSSYDDPDDALKKIKNEEQIIYTEKIQEKDKNKELNTYIGDENTIANNFSKIMDERYNYLFRYFVNFLFKYISNCKTKNGDNILIYMIKNFNDKESNNNDYEINFNQNEIIEIIEKIKEKNSIKISSFINNDALSLAISKKFFELSKFLITEFPNDYSKSCDYLKIFKEKLNVLQKKLNELQKKLNELQEELNNTKNTYEYNNLKIEYNNLKKEYNNLNIKYNNLKLEYNEDYQDLYKKMKCNYHEKEGGSNKKQKSKHHKNKKLGKKSKRKTRK
jgi:hypothetical protein